jgi:hypothetical protein
MSKGQTPRENRVAISVLRQKLIERITDNPKKAAKILTEWVKLAPKKRELKKTG